MSRKQAYPSTSKTRAVYPPIAVSGARQALIIPSAIEGPHHREWYWSTSYSGTFNHAVDYLRTEYIYVYMYTSNTATVVLSNPVFGTVEITLDEASGGWYKNVLRSGGQPIDITVVNPGNWYFYIYLAEGILVDGEAEVVRVRPKPVGELITIYGDNVVAGCRQVVYFEITNQYGDIEIYVNGEFWDYNGIFGEVFLDREVVVTARGSGFATIWTYEVYASEIVLDVDTAYIHPHYLYIYENNSSYDIPCIYREPVLGFSPGYDVQQFALVIEISQLKGHIDIDEFKGYCPGQAIP
ncbi:MAG: hypothetical protein QXN35_05075 [Ignisphaera sp.]